MHKLLNKIKRKYIEILLSHWYPKFSNFHTQSYYAQIYKKPKDLLEMTSSTCALLSWFITKPLLKVTTVFASFFKKKTLLQKSILLKALGLYQKLLL
tara:strand:- start:112 stop:402 length:291 start_codon:yes stop_codon:yes gene_type:complete